MWSWVSQPNNGCAPIKWGRMSQPNYEEGRLWPSRCNNKRSGDPQVALIQPYKGLDECHDVTKENGASSNTPHRVGIEDKSRHK